MRPRASGRVWHKAQDLERQATRGRLACQVARGQVDPEGLAGEVEVARGLELELELAGGDVEATRGGDLLAEQAEGPGDGAAARGALDGLEGHLDVGVALGVGGGRDLEARAAAEVPDDARVREGCAMGQGRGQVEGLGLAG